MSGLNQKGFTKNFLALMKDVEAIKQMCCDPSSSMFYVPPPPPYVPLARNGLRIDAGYTVLGQTNSLVGDPAKLLNNTEIPLNAFALRLDSTSLPVPISGAFFQDDPLAGVLFQVGQDNGAINGLHFSRSNINARRILTIPGVGPNLSIEALTGGYGAFYADARYTYSDGASVEVRRGSATITGIDQSKANFIYQNIQSGGSFPCTWSTILNGGIRPDGTSGTFDVTFANVLDSAVAVTRIQMDITCTNRVLNSTGFTAGLAIGPRISNPGVGSVIPFYSDILLGLNQSTTNAFNLTFTNKYGIYIRPIKSGVTNASTVTNAYGIYSEGTLDINQLNGFLRLTGIPTYADEAAAIIGGIPTGEVYKTATGELRIKL